MPVRRLFRDEDPARDRFHRDVEHLVNQLEGITVEVKTPALADQEFLVRHTLGRVPEGFSVRDQHKAGVLYRGAKSWTKELASFRYSAASDRLSIVLR